MDIEKIMDLLAGGENVNVEFKQSYEGWTWIAMTTGMTLGLIYLKVMNA